MWVDEKAWEGRVYSNGWQASKNTLEVREPATGDLLTEVGLANADDIAQAAIKARDAQKEWAKMPFAARADVFRKAAALLQEEFEICAKWIVRETGAIHPKAMFELTTVVTILHESASMITQPKGLVLPADGYTSLARRIPHGVVGVISPFNFPLILSSRSTMPALACGNAVVLKPDPRTPISGGFLLAQLLEKAGLPDGVLQVLPGEGDAGEALVCDPNIAMISFTGSTAIGRRVGELAGKHLKKVALELGGKNSLIVLEDADLATALPCGAFASYFHQGQICMSAGRHLVHKSLVDEYSKQMAEKAKHLPVGNPYIEQVALGPVITDKQAERVRAIIDGTIAMGATLLAGGKVEGRFVQPTVLVGVKPGMPAFDQEIFGPVVSITSFETDDEAVELANDTEYGLSAGILTGSVSRGLAVSERLKVGLVHVNDQTVNDDGYMPMGGQGASGNGSRHGGPANIDEFTQWQWTTFREKAPPYPF